MLVTVLLMVWYFLYVVAVVFTPGLSLRRVGGVDAALVFGVLQFAVAFLLAWRYSRYSRRVLDPLRAQLAADAERPVPVPASRGGR